MRGSLKLGLAAALAGASVIGFAATAASAEIVCNQANECWHVRGHHHYDYKPEWNVTVHPNNWRWGHDEHYKWHEHEGRGYWRDGVWIRF
jgi:hypothetical protein